MALPLCYSCKFNFSWFTMRWSEIHHYAYTSNLPQVITDVKALATARSAMLAQSCTLVDCHVSNDQIVGDGTIIPLNMSAVPPLANFSTDGPDVTLLCRADSGITGFYHKAFYVGGVIDKLNFFPLGPWDFGPMNSAWGTWVNLLAGPVASGSGLRSGGPWGFVAKNKAGGLGVKFPITGINIATANQTVFTVPGNTFNAGDTVAVIGTVGTPAGGLNRNYTVLNSAGGQITVQWNVLNTTTFTTTQIPTSVAPIYGYMYSKTPSFQPYTAIAPRRLGTHKRFVGIGNHRGRKASRRVGR
jgi:hypothetical protein